jgi:hypothetical protein
MDRLPGSVMKRAQQLTGTEKLKDSRTLLFHTFSDLNVFRILRLQNRLHAMHERLEKAEEHMDWTHHDDAELET